LFGRNFVGKQPFKWVDAGPVTVTPYHSHRVISLLHHVDWVHILGNFVDLKNLAAVYFIDAASALALDP
jgi:hypothetical protein